MMRFLQIDLARFIFAFGVVCIHVPLLGVNYYTPLLRCAVPFFYILTGFFLYSEDKINSILHLRRSLKRYFCLWIRYLVLFTALAVFFRFLYQSGESWVFQDLIVFIEMGFCKFVSHVTIGGVTYNIGSQIWYLYGGIVALFFLYFVRKWWFSLWINIIISLFYIIPIVVSWFYDARIPHFLYLSIPSLYLGMYLKRTFYSIKCNKRCFSWALLFCVIILYLEYWLACNKGAHVAAYLSTLPLTSILFLLILKTPPHSMLLRTVGGGGRIVLSVISLDIFIWHQFVYVIIVGVLGINLHHFDAIVIFLITFFVSFLIRKLMIK